MKCCQAGAECDRGTGEKLRHGNQNMANRHYMLISYRPIPKSYVQALESQVASLEVLLRRLADADENQRARMLAEFQSQMSACTPSPQQASNKPSSDSGIGDGDLSRARAKTGQLRRLITGGAAQFYGGTSLFQISLSEDSQPNGEEASQATTFSPAIESPSPSCRFPFGQNDAMGLELITAFFSDQCQFNMAIHREYFLRDYDAGSGRYCSDVLICAICAMGAVAAKDAAKRNLAEIYSQQAQILLYSSLDKPDITLLQALLVLGQCEIGRGRTSRGWLFCGMAFRLTHEMGLHLDPGHWVESESTSDQDIDREICRRVYWAAFILDKQLSLFFGRPPALYTYESDVRDPVRLPYPPNWESLLSSYGIRNSSVEDGITHVESLIHRAELAKILHRMITELFENRRSNTDDAVVVTTVQQINVALNRRLMTLPSRLHWNQWTIGQIPSSVIHLQ